MRIPLALLLLAFLTPAGAFEWKSDLYHCTASLPDGAGWQPIEASRAVGVEPLIVMQNAAKQAVFGINIVEKPPGDSVKDPAVVLMLEKMLRGFGYEFIGHSTVSIGGLDWLQYQVRTGSGAQPVTGVVRFASAGGYIFSITLLRGGGQQAAQDVELQQAAASFRIVPSTPIAAAAPTSPAGSAATPAARTAKTANETAPPAPDDEPPSADNSNRRMIWYGGAGILVLLILAKIIGGSGAPKKS